MTFENEPPLYTQMMKIANYIFTVIFIWEMVMKMQAYSYRYFETTWNKFDFFIVMASIVDVALEFTPTTGNDAFRVLPQVARILRVLRVTRIVKLAGKNEGL